MTEYPLQPGQESNELIQRAIELMESYNASPLHKTGHELAVLQHQLSLTGGLDNIVNQIDYVLENRTKIK